VPIRFYYDTMPEEDVFSYCSRCEAKNIRKLQALPYDVYDKIYQTIAEVAGEHIETEENKKILKLIADRDCTICHGNGWLYKKTIKSDIELANINAAAILRLMGFEGEDLISGEVAISDFRRAFIRALNADLTKEVTETTVQYGKPVEIVTSRESPSQLLMGGLTKKIIEEMLTKLGSFIEEATNNKAKIIYWQ